MGNKKSKIISSHKHGGSNTFTYDNPSYGAVGLTRINSIRSNPFKFVDPIELVDATRIFNRVKSIGDNIYDLSLVSTLPDPECKNTTKKFSSINPMKFGTDPSFKPIPKFILSRDERSIAGKTILQIIGEKNYDLLENFVTNNNIHQSIGHTIVLYALEYDNMELLKIAIKHRQTIFLRTTSDLVIMGHWMYWLDLAIEKQFEKGLVIYLINELSCYHLSERVIFDYLLKCCIDKADIGYYDMVASICSKKNVLNSMLLYITNQIMLEKPLDRCRTTGINSSMTSDTSHLSKLYRLFRITINSGADININQSQILSDAILTNNYNFVQLILEYNPACSTKMTDLAIRYAKPKVMQLIIMYLNKMNDDSFESCKSQKKYMTL